MKNCLLFALLLLGNMALAQPYSVIFTEANYQRIEASILKADTFFHTAMQPYRRDQMAVLSNTADTLEYALQKKWLQVIFNRDFIRVKEENWLQLQINPIFDLQWSRQMSPEAKNLTINSRGFLLQGTLGSKVGIETGFVESQSFLPDYVAQEARTNGFDGGVSALPQQGAYRNYQDGGFDFSYAFGHISYSPSKYFNIQAGHGKQFIGDGYRSLLLSDNSFFYPYLKLTTQVGRFQYTNLFTEFQNLDNNRGRPLLGRGHTKKHGSFHYLSVSVSKRLQIGFFEGIIWQATDSTGYQRGFDVNYLNPIIFYRPVEFALGSPDNAIMGFNIRYNMPNLGYAYGQMVLDDINIGSIFDNNNLGHINNKLGFQLGFNLVNFLKVEGLQWRNELNVVRPYTYSHRMVAQNYTHYSQSLTHPLGANFRELLSIVSYQKKRWQFRAELMAAKFGDDTNAFYAGKNPFKEADELDPSINVNGNQLFQGVSSNLMYAEIRAKYVYNSFSQLGIELRFSQRNLKPENGALQANSVFSIGISNIPINRYYDF